MKFPRLASILPLLLIPLFIQTANAARIPQVTSSKGIVKNVASIAKQFGTISYLLPANNIIPWVDKKYNFWYSIKTLYWLSLTLPNVVDSSVAQQSEYFSADTMNFVSKIDKHMKTLGFAFIPESSSQNTSGSPFYDYIHTYKKNKFVCSLVVEYNPDNINQVPVIFSCGSSLANDIKIQKPILQALEGTEIFVTIGKKVGNFVVVNYTPGRSGGYAILEKNRAGGYIKIYQGQELPPCASLIKYKVPRSLLLQDMDGSVYCAPDDSDDGSYFVKDGDYFVKY
jgi:hypothetical protein